MKILFMKIKLRAPWVHSLKEKRMVVRSIIQKLKNKFNISVSEIDDRDIYQIIVIGIVGICGNSSHTDSIMESIVDFVESHTDAEIIDISKENVMDI
ncbi:MULTISPECIES: DUF503 domain-containing protein [Clostridium]|uniref:DUF503 domain-containing protein n=1 Tax=Clostridium lapidicellarium TaxID=3240931 RepID=A0ABV4DXT6_9CLOT|nr:DUF503 domain-containing protein [uncultured Clostridium sp.]